MLARAAELDLHPRGELPDGEGLGDEVGGATLEAVDARGHVRIDGQHDDP